MSPRRRRRQRLVRTTELARAACGSSVRVQWCRVPTPLHFGALCLPFLMSSRQLLTDSSSVWSRRQLLLLHALRMNGVYFGGVTWMRRRVLLPTSFPADAGFRLLGEVCLGWEGRVNVYVVGTSIIGLDKLATLWSTIVRLLLSDLFQCDYAAWKPSTFIKRVGVCIYPTR